MKRYWNTAPDDSLLVHRREDDVYKFMQRNLTFDLLRRIIVQNKIKSILDLGCGFGLYFSLYHDLNCEVLAVDYSEPRLEIARKIMNRFDFKQITMKRMDVLKEDITGSFDLVLISYVFQHLPMQDVKTIIAKIREKAKYFVVLGYYYEPFKAFYEQHVEMCKRLDLPENTFDITKGVNSAAYNYPDLFKMPYEVSLFPPNLSVLLFKKCVEEGKGE